MVRTINLLIERHTEVKLAFGVGMWICLTPDGFRTDIIPPHSCYLHIVSCNLLRLPQYLHGIPVVATHNGRSWYIMWNSSWLVGLLRGSSLTVALPSALPTISLEIGTRTWSRTSTICASFRKIYQLIDKEPAALSTLLWNILLIPEVSWCKFVISLILGLLIRLRIGSIFELISVSICACRYSMSDARNTSYCSGHVVSSSSPSSRFTCSVCHSKSIGELSKELISLPSSLFQLSAYEVRYILTTRVIG
jgi:hypothetical protein